MKNTILITILLLSSYIAESQKYTLNLDTMDMFTETVIKEVKLTSIGNNYPIANPSLIFGIYGNDCYLKFNLFTTEYRSIQIREKDPLCFKFENKEILNFLPKKSYYIVQNIETKRTQIKAIYNIEVVALKMFSEFNVNQIRIYFNDTYYTYYPTKKDKEKIKQMASTILNIVNNNKY